jgi:hypothetical protein
MFILLESSILINRYIKEIQQLNREQKCPKCERQLRRHGHYKRTVFFKCRSFSIPILRRRCPSCDVTYSLLPFFLRPWMRFANHVRELFGRWLWMGVPLAQLPHKLSSMNISILSVRTLHRWKAQLKGLWEEWFLQQRIELARQVEEGEGLLPLYREGMGSVQEREFLVSCFLGEDRMPRTGAVLSQMNLQLPPDRRW